MMDCQFLETLADKLFKNFSKKKGLQIIIKYNLKISDYLHVTLNLNDGT